MIEAELCEVQQHYHSSIQAYEAAIDHAQLYDFDLDLAIAFELQGCVFTRKSFLDLCGCRISCLASGCFLVPVYLSSCNPMLSTDFEMV